MEPEPSAEVENRIADPLAADEHEAIVSVGDGKEHPVDPASITVIRIVAITWVGGVATVNALGLAIAWLFAGEVRAWVGLALLIVVATGAILSAFSYWWPGVRYRYLSYSVEDNGLVIRRGVVWRSATSIPLSRVQHTDVSQGPIQRWYGLATLIVHTAGTENASISLAGLPHAMALSVRDHLVSSSESDAV